MTEDNERKLTDVFRAVFNLAPEADVTDLRQLTTPAWDSLAHVSLIAALESEFGVIIGSAEFVSMTSYQGIKLYLEEQSR